MRAGKEAEQRAGLPEFKRDNASRLRDAERCMKGGEPLTVREASFISSLMGLSQEVRYEDSHED